MMNSFTEENYLKAIYKLWEKSAASVSTNAIAEKMHTKAASVSDMMKKLARKKLINYQKYQGVTLTASGKKIAVDIIRKHRLWEVFLVEKLNFKWDEVHDMAEQLEHINSDELTKRIDKFLGYPRVDPHGDPIPDSNGVIQLPSSSLLSEMKKNNSCTMIGVVDHSPAFLQYLDKAGILLGNEIKINETVEYDRSMIISLKNKNNLHISFDVAKNILVKGK